MQAFWLAHRAPNAGESRCCRAVHALEGGGRQAVQKFPFIQPPPRHPRSQPGCSPFRPTAALPRLLCAALLMLALRLLNALAGTAACAWGAAAHGGTLFLLSLLLPAYQGVAKKAICSICPPPQLLGLRACHMCPATVCAAHVPSHILHARHARWLKVADGLSLLHLPQWWRSSERHLKRHEWQLPPCCPAWRRTRCTARASRCCSGAFWMASVVFMRRCMPLPSDASAARCARHAPAQVREVTAATWLQVQAARAQELGVGVCGSAPVQGFRAAGTICSCSG